MTPQFDLAVIGAGPAGLAAATVAREAGLSVVVLDEQAEPGGQIYRNIAKNSVNGQELNDILGPDYMRGAALVEAFRNAGVDYWAGASVWQVDPDLTISLSRDGVHRSLRPAESSSRPARWNGRCRFPAGRCPA